MRLVNWGSVRSTEVTKVTVHRSAEVTWSQMLGECCRLCLDVVHLLKSKRKVLNKGLILNYLPLLVSAHLPYMSWIRIRICISPYGSGSDLSGSTNPDPDPHHWLTVGNYRTRRLRIYFDILKKIPPSPPPARPWHCISSIFLILAPSRWQSIS